MSETTLRLSTTTRSLHSKAGVKNKSLKQSKGTGASGSFKIVEVAKPVKKKPAKVKKAVKPKDSQDPHEDNYQENNVNKESYR